MITDLIEFERFLRSEEFFDYSRPVGINQTLTLSSEKKANVDSNLSTSDYLVTFSTKSQSYCVGYVDIVNSTKISASLPSSNIAQYYEIFLNSMSKIIGRFNGKVIKNLGDCLLYYFPNSEDSSEVGMKNCLNCGVAMVKANEFISEELKSKNLPKLNYRISSDFGNVVLMNTSVSPNVDLIGPPVNMCAKINHCASKNEFVIGGDIYQYVKHFNEFEYNEVKSCDGGFEYSYPVYKVTSSY
jgi:class 3 adenylate cyclase